MVTVTNFNKRATSDGREFITLELQGGLELVVSKTTGNVYATTKKCSIPTTFSEQIAEKLIGTELGGEIIKQDVEPYSFTNPRTGETMMLNYSWTYKLNAEAEPLGSTKVQEIEKVKK